MSRQELVESYLEGGVSRRSFVRRLVASGVSIGAAASYAEVLAPATATAAPRRARRAKIDDLYPLVTMKITTRDIHDVRSKDRLRVKVTSNSVVVLHVSAFVEKNGHLSPLGFMPYDPESNRTFAAGESRTVTVPIYYQTALNGLQKAKVFVEATTNAYSTFTVAKATLK
jgi:hypothetical protein